VATRSAPPRQPRRTTRPRRPVASSDRRIRVLLGLSGIALALLLGRAVQLQIVDHAAFVERASGQHRVEIVTEAPRGAILDRDGYRLALSERAQTIGATPSLVTDPARVIAVVAEASGVSPDAIKERLEAEGALHVDLARQVPPAAAKRVQAMDLAGLDFTPEERRVYPSAIAAPVIGIVDLEGEGLAGLELQYDEALRGVDGLEVRTEDPGGNAIQVLESTPMRRGATITTSLDRDVQRAAESVIADTLQEYRAKAVTAIVLDPRTGEILALASAPGPEGGDFRRGTDEELRIRAITDVYEPGSTFKSVTLAAGLATGRITPRTRVEVGDEWQLYDGVLTDPHPNPGIKTATEAIRQSSNIGVAKLAYEHLSDPRGRDIVLAEWIDRFGFGSPTGIDLPGEVAGITTPYDKWSGTSPLNIPIGHGIATTPMQVAQLYATIAAGGVERTPHLVTRIGDQGPVEVEARRVMPRRAARQLAVMLEGVVSDQGTGAAADIIGYSVAGKTGTTKKIDEATGRYSDSRYLSWFVGFAPARDPRVVTLVMVDEPRGDVFYGGDVAGPAFSRLTERALIAMGAEPDQPGEQADQIG
jgi:cell division protein FtsI (penicillin-binding protein 3)